MPVPAKWGTSAVTSRAGMTTLVLVHEFSLESTLCITFELHSNHTVVALHRAGSARTGMDRGGMVVMVVEVLLPNKHRAVALAEARGCCAAGNGRPPPSQPATLQRQVKGCRKYCL